MEGWSLKKIQATPLWDGEYGLKIDAWSQKAFFKFTGAVHWGDVALLLLGGHQGVSWVKARDQLGWGDILRDTSSMKKPKGNPWMIPKGKIWVKKVFINTEGRSP